MNMRIGLLQQQQTRLSMTQELSQAIALLQYNAQELSSFLEARALDNPLLEIVPSGQPKDRSRKKSVPRDKENDINGIASETGTTLEEHLLSQLNPARFHKDEHRLIRQVILNIDENGYFRGDINEIALNLKVTPAHAEECLHEIQQLDPPGIGARNLQECLLLQLDRIGEKVPLARVIVEGYFPEFAEKKWKKLAKDLRISLQEVQEIYDLLQKLNPRPGAAFHQERAAYLVPDVVADCINGQWSVHLVEGNLPSIGFNDEMYNSLTNSGDIQAIKFLQDKYQDYQWLTKSIRQRNETLLKVAGKIIEKQPFFFSAAKRELIPLTMKEIAESLDIHESTVSRAVREKYLGTPFGTFELKSFFSSGIGTVSESSASSAQVKKLIAAIIGHEDKRQPVSDQDIAEMLKENEGLVISRRTVAKYREQLGIGSSSKRKRF
ncbi:RNA polymerase sigma-54 factor [Neobacillus piezotolerans]|uniref:RNA polymerase sigma-54 factor n=1 Tax=Neobacillus piezotolerans TaxID=2259171 RepID=A0A3D8GTB5_9BACI|nr:RNA polymerase factor sigma-54 [Neobacillus piezotolerans]RDU37688.1 RNA polymerase sigma-54 factor [Neobacillus piezotolerans]